MLDKFLLNVVNSGDRVPLNLSLSPQGTLLDLKSFHAKDPTKLVVIFPYWSSSSATTMIKLARKLSLRQCDVLLPELHENYMQANIDFVISTYQYLSHELAKQITDHCLNANLQSVHLIGFSMGNVLLCNTAQYLDQIPQLEITQVLGASEIAGPLWEGSRTAHLRQSFIDQGVDLQALRESWRQIDPITIKLPTNISKIELLSSRHDSVIPTRYQEKYADHLATHHPRLLHKRLSTNHILSLARFIYLHTY